MRDIKDDIKDLFINHKRATALSVEYTAEIYSYLVDNGFLKLTPKQKYDISNQARKIYEQELHQRIATEKLQGSQTAFKVLEMLRMGRANQKMKDYMVSICKRIGIQQYFDLIDNLKI